MSLDELKMWSDFKKVKKVLNHPSNEERHKKVLTKYLFLFLDNWRDKKPLKNKIIKNYVTQFYTY